MRRLPGIPLAFGLANALFVEAIVRVLAADGALPSSDPPVPFVLPRLPSESRDALLLPATSFKASVAREFEAFLSGAACE